MNFGSGVRVLSPGGAIAPTGTWSVGARAGDFVFVAGMRGINPTNNSLVQGEEARIRQAFLNMKSIAESEGASLADCVRLTVFVTDMSRLRTLVNKLQEELWSGSPYPPTHYCRGRCAQSGRLFRGGRHLLCAKNPMIRRMALGLAVSSGIHISAKEAAAPPNRMGFYGHRAIHRQ